MTPRQLDAFLAEIGVRPAKQDSPVDIEEGSTPLVPNVKLPFRHVKLDADGQPPF